MFSAGSLGEISGRTEFEETRCPVLCPLEEALLRPFWRRMMGITELSCSVKLESSCQPPVAVLALM